MKFRTFLFLVACGGGAWYYFHDKDDAPNMKEDKSAAVAKQEKAPAAEKDDAPKVKDGETAAVPKREESPTKEEPSQGSGRAKTVSVDDAVQMLKRYGILDENASGKLVTSIGSDMGKEYKENPIKAISEEFLYHFMMYKDGVENLSEYPYIDKALELYRRANTEQQELQAQGLAKLQDDVETLQKGMKEIVGAALTGQPPPQEETQVRILRRLPVQCLEALTAAGVKISSFQGCSENLFAVNPPDPKLVAFLCTQCAKTSPDQVNVAGANGWTPLMTAARYFTADVCRHLIQAGANVNAKQNDGWTPLMCAARYSTADVCQLLIQAGADIDAKKDDGWTALSLAVFCGDDDKVDTLINNRANVRVPVSYGGKRVSLLELAEELNQELSNSFKKESLMKNVREGYPGAKLNYQEVIKLLGAVSAARIPQYESNDAGDDSFSTDREPLPPPNSGMISSIPATELAKLDPLIARMRALRCKHASSALYQRRLLTLLPMIRNGADINITLQETKGNTALHYSCAIGSWSITQWLVNHGADVNAVTDAGATPLDCVGSDNGVRIRALLLAHGARYAFELGVNSGRRMSSPRQTDMDIAAQNGDAEAQYRLGLAYQFAKGKPQNYSEAARWYRRAAEQGHAAAQNNLGFCYHNGWGVPQDYSQAAYWYRLSAQQGLPLGESNYGTCLEFGWGVRKDLGAAIEMYRRAALQGNASGKKHLRRHGITP